MTTCTFVSMSIEERTATFNVNGENITRPISQEVTDETLADHLQALANGLIIEAEEKAKQSNVDVITAIPIDAGITYEYVEPVVTDTEQQ